MDLNRAATFLRVVEAGGFTAAATALGLPTSSVSRSVARLEQDLGVNLLERTTRRVSLTDAGRAYFERVRDALAGLDEATALALDAARAPHGVVRIAAPPDFAPALGQLLAPFLREHPRIRIELTVSTRGADLVGDQVDLGLVLGRLPDSSLIVRRVGDAAHHLYAAPSYLEARGQPRSSADLARHDAIVLRGGSAVWDLVGPGGPESIEVRGAVSGDHLGFIIEAAIAGLGIALIPAFSSVSHVEAGALVHVLPRHSSTIALQLVTHGTRHLPHRVALVRDLLARELTGRCNKHACTGRHNGGGAPRRSVRGRSH